MRPKIVYQSQAKGCGYAAIKMALIHSSGRKDFAYAWEPPILSHAPSIADLVSYASNHGLTLVPYKVIHPEDLKNNTEYPLLIVIRENCLTHMVYLIAKRRRNYIVLDPGKGKRSFRLEEMHEKFIGTFLCERSYHDVSPKFYKKTALPRRFFFFDALFTILPSLFLLCGLFLLDFAPLWLGMGLISLSLVSLIASRLVKLHNFKEFDRLFGYRLLEDNTSKRKTLYEHFYTYKGLAFTSLGGLLSSILEFLLAIGIFSFRNIFFGMVLCIASLMATGVELLDSPRQKKASEVVEEKENAFLSFSMNEEERKLSLLSLFASSGSFAGTMLAKEVFSLATSIGLGAAAMAITGVFDFESFVYYTMGITIVLQCLKSSFSQMELVERKKREEPYFLYHFLPDGEI
ncbi:MAG: hypothetical protein II721_02730 [Bacilli bacterium]|nr:hypothetical protein [Bacilli bacterium]